MQQPTTKKTIFPTDKPIMLDDGSIKLPKDMILPADTLPELSYVEWLYLLFSELKSSPATANKKYYFLKKFYSRYHRTSVWKVKNRLEVKGYL